MEFLRLEPLQADGASGNLQSGPKRHRAVEMESVLRRLQESSAVFSDAAYSALVDATRKLEESSWSRGPADST